MRTTEQALGHTKADLTQPARARFAWQLRPWQRERVARCRVVRCAPSVQLVEREQKANGECRLGFRGLVTCGSVHSCPLCASSILSHRAEELTKGLDVWRRERTAMVTFTLRHSTGMPLRVLRKILAAAYSELKAGRKGQALRRAVGHQADVRAAEVTHGGNGWHPHLHALWFADSRVEPRDWHMHLASRWQDVVRQVITRMHTCAIDCIHANRLVDDEEGTVEAKRAALRRKAVRLLGSFWARPGWELERIGEAFLAALPRQSEWDGILPDMAHGVDVQRLDNRKRTGTYLAKMGLELTAIMSKRGAKGSRTPWDLAREAVAGNFISQGLWSEYQGAMFGSRQLTWSRTCRELLGLGAEVADADIPRSLAEPEPAESERCLGSIEGATWDSMTKSRGQLVLAFIQDAYNRGELDRLGVVKGEPTIWKEVPITKHQRLNYWEDWDREREAHERGRILRKCPAPPKEDPKRWFKMSLEERHEWIEEVRHRMQCDLFCCPPRDDRATPPSTPLGRYPSICVTRPWCVS